MLLYLFLATVASAFMAGGLLMMKSRSDTLPVASGWRVASAVLAWIRNPMWIGGLAVQTLGYALYIVVISRLPVSMVAVMMQGGIAIFVIFAAIILGERAQPREWAGIVAIVFGMVLLSLSLGSGSDDDTLNWRALATVSAVLLVLGIAPMTNARMRANGIAAAILSGITFGLGSLYAKGMTTDFLALHNLGIALRIAENPYVYLTIVANIGGIVLLQNSFAAARGIIAMPLSSALSNLIPIVGGMAAFGERLPAAPQAAAMRIVAFVLTITAGGLLAGAREGERAEPAPEPAHAARSRAGAR